MADKMSEVYDTYEMEIFQTARGRGSFILKTDKGIRQLKQLDVNESRLNVEYQFKEKLYEHGFTDIDRCIKNVDEELVSYDRYGNGYVMRSFFDGREIEVTDIDEVKAAVTNLAYFHKVSKKIWESTEKDVHIRLNSDFKKRNQELKRVKNFMMKRKSKKKFEEVFLENYDFFYKQALECENMLGPDDLKLMEEHVGYCHGMYNQHSILVIESRKTYESETDGIKADGIETNGIETNGIKADGIKADGIKTDGIETNGIKTDGIKADVPETSVSEAGVTETVSSKTGENDGLKADKTAGSQSCAEVAGSQSCAEAAGSQSCAENADKKIRLATIGFDKFYVGNQLNDLYHFIRKTVEKNNYSFEVMREILENYDKIFKLRKKDLEYIYILYLYPEKFYKLSNQYINAPKNWISPKMMEKMGKIIDEESKKQTLLGKLHRYYLEN